MNFHLEVFLRTSNLTMKLQLVAGLGIRKSSETVVVVKIAVVDNFKLICCDWQACRPCN